MEPIGDGQIFTQPTIMGPKADQRKRTTIYQYRSDRAKRTLLGIDEQIAKWRRRSRATACSDGAV